MSIRVIVEDLETGDREEKVVKDGDYLLVTTEPCHVKHMQVYPKSGTHVITVRGVQRGD